MKKRIIALSVAAAMGGFAGSASAQVPQANHLAYNASGVGHILYVPYFSAQEGNVTAINIINTDTVNGKAVKMRFRGASNSDDVYDFQVFLSPGDVWAAGIAKGSDGRARLDTADVSCTLPAKVSGPFITSRTAPQAANQAAETLEGYVEILNMGDIYDDGSSGDTITQSKRLFTAVKHVSNVAPCTSSVLSGLTRENSSSRLRAPTTGLMANWFIVNVNKKYTYSGAATAVEARWQAAEGVVGVPSTGKLVYWDQRDTGIDAATAAAYTADPLLQGAAPWVSPARYDLPDLSTPYTTRYDTLSADVRPTGQAFELSDALAANRVAGEFYSLASVGATTDWVISFPTRRYFAAVRYTGTNAPRPVYNSIDNPYFNASNTAMSTITGRTYQLCQELGFRSLGFWNREETATNIDNIVISPGQPRTLSLCGEVSALSVNNTDPAKSATFASLTWASADNGFVEGWGTITTPGASGLPMIGTQFTRVNNTQTNEYYGWTYPMRVIVRP